MRRPVSTIVDAVNGTTVASCSGRAANFARPRTAIPTELLSPGPSTAFGAGVSGSVPHSCDSRFAPPTPSTLA